MKKLSKTLSNREFRPRQAVYTPVYFSYLRHSIKALSPMYLYDANPGMPPKGILKFSKWHILSQIQEQYRPKTFLLASDTYYPKDQITKYVQELGHYPIIAKPDLGERGSEVAVIRDEPQLQEYLTTHRTEDLLLQEFITSSLELGVFRYRYPDQDRGHISGITTKEFFTVTGDGTLTLRQLVEQDERGIRYTQLFAEIQGDRYEAIIPEGEDVQLSHVGNHSKGTTFLNGNHLITNELVDVFDTIASQIEGFYYGRFDIKVTSLQDLYAGRGISVLEVNGVQSEPTHIYQPNASLGAGLKELMEHRQVMYEISRINRRTLHQRSEVNIVEHISDQALLHKKQKYQPHFDTNINSLPKLTDAIHQHIQRQCEVYGDINLQRCQYILDLYSGDDRKDKVSFADDHYTRFAVQMPDGIDTFDIYIMGRDVGQMSDIHDHASNGCIMKFVDGEVTERRHNKTVDGMELQKETIYHTGQSAYIADDIGYHAIGTAPGVRAVSIHVYSPAQWKTTFFRK